LFGARIIVADSDARFRQKLNKLLTKAGYLVVAEEDDGRKAIQAIHTMQPDLVIIDSQLPGKNGLEIAKIVEEGRVAPVLLLTAYNHREMVEKAKESWVFAYLVKPVNEANLFPAMEIAMANYRKLIKLEQKISQLEETLETRKLVDRAKGMLMETLNISEPQSFRLLQTQSMQRRQSMRQVAEIILSYSVEQLKEKIHY